MHIATICRHAGDRGRGRRMMAADAVLREASERTSTLFQPAYRFGTPLSSRPQPAAGDASTTAQAKRGDPGTPEQKNVRESQRVVTPACSRPEESFAWLSRHAGTVVASR